MTPETRQTLEAALALIADVNDADAWALLTAETRTALTKLGATFGGPLTAANGTIAHWMTLGCVSAVCSFDNGEHLILRWAANARAKLAEGTDANG